MSEDVSKFPRVTVVANDYTYEGWLTVVFRKMRGNVRCVVEDENGRLFIHNPTQIKGLAADVRAKLGLDD